MRDNFADCMICGKPLVYSDKHEMKECFICHKKALSNCECESGHFVCDECHAKSAIAFFVPYLLESSEKDPIRLLEQVMALKKVHMHGPEHHIIVPCVLLTAYKNSGGNIDLEETIGQAVMRGKQVPGGVCGFWGACGSAIGAGIYMSIITGDNPLNEEKWPLAQKVTAACLERNAEYGGPRCCKRTARTAVETASEMTFEATGVKIEFTRTLCGYVGKNKDCIGERCPYYPGVEQIK